MAGPRREWGMPDSPGRSARTCGAGLDDLSGGKIIIVTGALSDLGTVITNHLSYEGEVKILLGIIKNVSTQGANADRIRRLANSAH